VKALTRLLVEKRDIHQGGVIGDGEEPKMNMKRRKNHQG
jgi:hypothetical protein